MGTRRRIAVRVALGAYFAIAAAWLVSGWSAFGWERVDASGRRVSIFVQGGSVVWQSSWGFKGPATSPIGSIDAERTGWQGWELWYGRRSINGFGIVSDLVRVPLWMPVVLTGVPAAALWWRGRGPKPGHCRCGYDLAGIAEGVCPECGASG